MIVSDLAWVVQVPIPCGNCGKEELEIIARFIYRTERPCGYCGVLLDLNTKEWAEFRHALKEFHVGKKAPIAPVKK